MKLLLQRQKYLIKNMGALMPVPIAAIYVLALPLCIVQSRNGNAEELRSFVSQFSQGVFFGALRLVGYIRRARIF